MCIQYSVLFSASIPQLSDIIHVIENISGLNDFEYSNSLPYSISHDFFEGSIDLRTSANPNELLIDAFHWPQKYLEALTIHACINLGGEYSNKIELIAWGSRKWNEIPSEIRVKLA